MKNHYHKFPPSLTVHKFQEVVKLAASVNLEKLDQLDKIKRIYCTVLDITGDQFEELTLEEVREKAKTVNQLLFLNIPGKPKQYIKVAGKKYFIQYDPARLTTKESKLIARYGNYPIGNLHYLLATIAYPVEYGWKYWKTGFKKTRQKTDEEYEAIAQQMLQAPLTEVFATCAYFCRLFMLLIKEIRPAIKKDMTATGMSGDIADNLIDTSVTAMEEFYQLSKYQPVHH